MTLCNDTVHLTPQNEMAIESPPVEQIVTYSLPHIYEKRSFIHILATPCYDCKSTQCGRI